MNHLEHIITVSDSDSVISYKGKSVQSIRKAFRMAIERSNLKPFRFHDLRHTFASRLVMVGVDIRTVQELLGHKDIRMTMKYSHPTEDHKAKAVESVLYFGTNVAHEKIETRK